MKTQPKCMISFIAALCCTLGMACRIHADWFYDFQTPPPASFHTGSDPRSGTFSASVSDGVLHFSDTTLPADGGALVGRGAEASQVFRDVRVTGTLNPARTTTNLLFLNARSDGRGNLYLAGIAFADGPTGERAGNLLIIKIAGGIHPLEIVQSSDDSQGNQPPLADLARSYFLQWDLVGNQQTARVLDQAGGTQLLMVTYEDTGANGPPYVSGVAGMSAVSTGGVVDATFGPIGAAAPKWFYDFQTSPPASFVTGSDPPSGTFSVSVGGGVLHFSDTALPADGGAFVGHGAEMSQVFSDVRVTGTLNPAGTTNNLLFLNARSDGQGDLYLAGIAFADGPTGERAGSLVIIKLAGAINPLEVIQSSDDNQGNQPPLADLGSSYFLQWDLVGNQQTARVFDGEGGTQLLLVNYTDTGAAGPPYTVGFAGASAVSTGGVVDATFGPIGAGPIP
jgi:hypothetical protein